MSFVPDSIPQAPSCLTLHVSRSSSPATTSVTIWSRRSRVQSLRHRPGRDHHRRRRVITSRNDRTARCTETERLAGLPAGEQGSFRRSQRGIALARGEYILPLDADNCIRSDYPLAAIELLETVSDIGVVYGDCELIGRQKGRRHVPD